MGAGLAMRYLLFGLAALALAACSNDTEQENVITASASFLREAAKSQLGLNPPPQPFSLTRAQLADYPLPLIVVTRSDGFRAGLVPTGTNGPYASWQALDGVGLSFRQGVISASRGTGPDLLAADVADTAARIAARQAGPAARSHRRLDGDNNIVVTRYSCQIENNGTARIEILEVAQTTTQLTERCQGATPETEPQTLENRYWVGADGTIWRSEQWAGAGLGRVIVEQLLK